MGFVVGYAPCGLSPQTDGMPVIHKRGALTNASPDNISGQFLLYGNAV
jgi:hypothetical protein